MQIKNLKIRPIVTIVLLMMVTFFCQPILVEGASVIYTEKDIYNQGEMIGVHFANAPGYDSDWIPDVSQEHRGRVGIERQIISENDRSPVRLREECAKDGQGLIHYPEGYGNPDTERPRE